MATSSTAASTTSGGMKGWIIGVCVALTMMVGAPAGIVGMTLMMAGGGMAARADSIKCQPAGDSGAAGPAPDQSSPSGKEQVENAKLIDEAAKKLGLSGKATWVALVAAVGESDVINLAGGDRDSQGVFQQRPSMGWKNVRDVEYAATSFLTGQNHDGKGGLVSVPDWPSMAATIAIFKVQANDNAQHYTKFEGRARQIAEAAGIDLERAGATTLASAPPDAAAARADGIKSNYCGGNGSSDGRGGNAGPKPDANGECPLDKPGKVSCNAAIAFAELQISNNDHSWHNWCLRFVSTAYGSSFAGYNTAYDAALDVQAHGGMHHDVTPDGHVAWDKIPRGAAMWLDGRNVGNTAGHAFFYVGNGWVYSTDAPTADGRVGLVPVSVIESWGQVYMGWSAPYVG